MSTAISTTRRERARQPRGPNFDSGLAYGLFSSMDEIYDWALSTAAIMSLFLSFKFGALAIIVFIVSTGILVVRSPWETLKGTVKYWVFFVFPLYCVLSTEWSKYPELTIRAALQLLLTYFATVVIAHRINGRQFIAGLLVSTFVTCLFCIAYPRTHLGPEGLALVGIMGSKNQMSFLAGCMASAALAVAADPKHLSLTRLAAAVAMLLGLVLLVAAKSAGGTIGTLVSGMVFVGVVITGYMRARVRIFLLALLLIISAPVVVMRPVLEAASEDFMVNVLHKDMTLTGRTYLWARGNAIIAERPVLGVGYHAFWVQGEPDPEGLWKYAGIGSRSGFNFHNQYMDILVQTGWVGLVTMVIGMILVGLGVSLEALFVPSIASAYFFSNGLVSLIRSFTETTLIAEFSFYAVVFYAGGIYAWAALAEARAATQAASRPGGLRPRPGVERPRGRLPARLARGATPQA